MTSNKVSRWWPLTSNLRYYQSQWWLGVGGTEHEIVGALRPISDHLLKMTEQCCLQSAIWLTIVWALYIYKLTCINCTQNNWDKIGWLAPFFKVIKHWYSYPRYREVDVQREKLSELALRLWSRAENHYVEGLRYRNVCWMAPMNL